MKTKIIEGIVLGIYSWKDNSAKIKILTSKGIYFILVKSFYKMSNKNKNNIFIGLISSFEIIDQYSKDKYFFLKRANLLHFIDLSIKENQLAIQKIIPILQKFENPSNDFYNTYKNFLIEWNIMVVEWFITYCSKELLISRGENRELSFCVKCKKNKSLFSFNFYEGGIFCFKHSIDSKYTISDLDIIKSIYYLGTDFKKYCKITNYFTNKIIFNILNSIDY